VTPCGRRISLKGAVAHFFLSFFLSSFSFLTQLHVLRDRLLRLADGDGSPMGVVRLFFFFLFIHYSYAT